jgi:hypothetical protein
MHLVPINDAEMRRLNGKEAAAILNVSVWTVYAMKRAGAPFTGRYCTIADLDAWWRAHPDFCASRIWRDSTASKTLDRRSTNKTEQKAKLPPPKR